jgi:endogenous inhibitor of DNA gyrase (YacG/DUF329 family)
MHFVVLPEQLTLHLLRGESDPLTQPSEERIAAIKKTPCPRCGSSLHPRVDAARPFTEQAALPRLLAKCPTCDYEKDVTTGIVLSTGNGAKVDDPFPVINVDRNY